MKKFVVISHTHWDREWYMSFSAFRLRLVDLIDRFFAVLEKDPDYVFHLDAQTVVLEDYLQIRPENEALLKKYISSGNLRVGPWYLQNDFYLTDGEATIRNLMIGTALAEQFGKCGKVGYAPDQFGHITQLPQILAGFGIDNYVFGRGFKCFAEEGELALPAEFEWVGADGTRCIAVHLKYWYNNAQHIPEETELANLLLDINEKHFDGLNVSPYILLMNGVDHLEAQEDVRDVIARLNKEGRQIEQSNLDDYISAVKEAVRGKKLYSYRGALNKGRDYDILKGCWSSRIYLKRENVRAQDMILHAIEPLYSYLAQSGFQGVYPKDELRFLWKALLKNHPHDSICGCSTDAVHRHMEDSFSRIGEFGEELLARGMKLAAAHSLNPMNGEENYSVTVFNPTERVLSAVTETELDFLLSENISSFAIFDGDGREIPYEILTREAGVTDVFSPLNLPGVLDVCKTRIRFPAEEIAPFSAKTFAVVPHKKGRVLTPKKELENEFYAVSVENGALLVKDKRTGKTYRDPFVFEDEADKGDAYVFRKAPELPERLVPVWEEPRPGALSGRVTGRVSFACPAHYDFERDRRSGSVSCELRVALELREGDGVLSLSYEIDNRACDHRIRLSVTGGLTDGALFTDSPFDCAARSPYESCPQTDSNTHHNSTFAVLTDGKEGVTVYTEGQHEVENRAGNLLFTVLRATGVINRDEKTFRPTGGKTWDVPENQCIRTVRGRVGVRFAAYGNAADAYAEGKAFRVGLLVRADSFDPKKYSGGRFAVQSAKLEKLYYLKDVYAGCAVLPGAFFRVPAGEIAVTCCKEAERGGSVVRLVNLSDRKVETDFGARGKIYLCSLSEREETYMGEGKVKLSFLPKQIITVRCEYVLS